ncbi:MAG: hypothetical protein WCW16_00390 [Candidatus Magasanikbacteria bacterium]
MPTKILTHVLLDALTIVYIFFGLEYFTHFTQNNLVLVFYIVALLHLIALGSGLYSKVRTYGSGGLLGEQKNNWTHTLQSLVTILAFASSLWLIFPGVAITKIISHNMPGLGILIVLFLLFPWVLLAIGMSHEQKKWKTPAREYMVTQLLPSCATLLFFATSETLIKATAQNNATSLDDVGFGIIMLAITYLPLRLLLMLKQPIKKIDFVSAIITFGLLAYAMVA